MKEIGADFYGITGHKFYGPTGIGVLYGRRELLDELEPFEGGGSMISKVTKDKITWAAVPAKFEAGTPPIAEAIGLGAAVDWVNGIGLENIGAHERELAAYALPRLNEIPGMTIFGPPGTEDREGIISFELEGVHPHDISEILDRHGVAVRAGHHCAQILMNRLDVPATTRASFAVYNTTEDGPPDRCPPRRTPHLRALTASRLRPGQTAPAGTAFRRSGLSRVVEGESKLAKAVESRQPEPDRRT